MCNNSHTGRKEAKSEAGEELAYIVHICSHSSTSFRTFVHLLLVECKIFFWRYLGTLIYDKNLLNVSGRDIDTDIVIFMSFSSI
jgi:hypothetical protein